MAEVWLVASGKGGVGKTTLTAALGCALCDLGKTVCIVDADIGLRDQDSILGLENRIVYDIVDVADRNCGLTQALVTMDGRENLKLLPAAQFARVKDVEGKQFRRIIKRLRDAFDVVLVDCPAGIEKGYRNVLSCTIDRALILSTPDDLCIRNAERALQLLRNKDMDAFLIVNRLQEDLIRSGVMYSAKTVALTMDIPLVGEIPEDPEVYRTLLRHGNLLDVACPAAEAVKRIAARLTGAKVPFPQIGKKPLPWYKRIFARKEAAAL